MKLINRLTLITLLLVFFSCEEKENIIDGGNYYLSHKEYTLDSLSGNIINSDIITEDFQSAEECMECHLEHYQEWSSSFHATSFSDPVFMSIWSSEKDHRPLTGVNYCVQCHAPAAFVSGYDLDGVQGGDDASLPDIIREGVSCDICHTMVNKSPSVHTQDHVAAVAQYYINPGENIKYGSIESPDTNSYHESLYLPLFNSSSSCKPCHNQSIRGMPIEMTFSEWDEHPGLSMAGPSCQSCHMKKQADGHSSHYFAGVDLLFYNGLDESSDQYKEVINLLNESVNIDFEYLNPQTGMLDSVRIENDSLFIPISINNLTGHKLPSGTSFSREAWLELLVINSTNDTIYQKGLVVNSSDTLDYNDESLMLYTTILYDEGGEIIHEASNAFSYHDRTLRTLFYDTKTYSIYLEEQTNQELLIKARMLFRSFKPQMLDQFHPEANSFLPIIQMDADSLTLISP